MFQNNDLKTIFTKGTHKWLDKRLKNAAQPKIECMTKHVLAQQGQCFESQIHNTDDNINYSSSDWEVGGEWIMKEIIESQKNYVYQLTELPDLSECVLLKRLYCAYNQLIEEPKVPSGTYVYR